MLFLILYFDRCKPSLFVVLTWKILKFIPLLLYPVDYLRFFKKSTIFNKHLPTTFVNTLKSPNKITSLEMSKLDLKNPSM